MENLLNENQIKAVQNTGGPLIIIAGPGTGKTKTLVSKIEYLIKNKISSPNEILALTFTNKSANEINERLSKVFKSPLVNAYTFHSFANKTISFRGDVFKLASDSERRDIMENIVRDNGIKIRDFQINISRFKNWATFDKTLNNISTSILINTYNEELFKKGLIDYDDLLLKVYELVNSNKEYRDYLKEKYKYILIDEFQDTNKIQYEFVKLILNQNNNICVIGDPNQSIYAFRGAEPKSFNIFKSDFPNFKEIELTKNYRSLNSIVTITNNLFNSTAESVVTEENGETVHISTVDEYTQAKWIVSFINRKIGGINLNEAGEFWGNEDEKINFSDFAVIYRKHSQNRVLKKVFYKSGIPYQVVGDGSIFYRKEIKFIIDCLSYIQNGNAENLTENELHSIPVTEISKNIVETIVTLVDIFKLDKNFDNQSLNELTEFYNLASFYEKHKNSIQEFLHFIEYLKSNDYFDDKGNKVSLVTIHSAKGLEFDYVFIAGFNDGIIPNEKENIYTDNEEEKRLLYVAMSRAKKGLYLISFEEGRNGKSMHPSRYLSSIKCDSLKISEDSIKKRIEEKRRKERVQKAQMKMF